jgi:neutral ceramidase
MRPLLLILACLACSAGEFRAGAARINLDPPLGLPMVGYGARNAQGLLDPLQARALVLSDGTRTLALVTLDLCFLFDVPEMEQIRAAVRPKGADEVIFHASHTHSAPSLPANREAYAQAVQKIEQVIAEAAAALEPARIGSGFGMTYIGHNRRRTLADGSLEMLWRDEPGVSTSPVDPTVGVIRIDHADGRPLAILVNYACHPVVLGPDNLKYSADYPGEMRNAIEEALGGTAFFLQGAPGDINPFYDKTPLEEDAVAAMKQTGRKLAAEAVRVANGLQTRTPAAASVTSKTTVVHANSRWNLPVLREVLQERYHLEPSRATRLLRESMDLPVTTLLLNRDIAFVTMPGEPFVEFQTQLRAKSPLANTFFLGYTNGYFAYFPTIAAAVRGGYGADSTVTMAEVGTGERMLNVGLVSLYELLGKLSPKPAKGEW